MSGPPITRVETTAIRAGAIELTEAPGLRLALDEEVARGHWHRKGGIPAFGPGPGLVTRGGER